MCERDGNYLCGTGFGSGIDIRSKKHGIFLPWLSFIGHLPSEISPQYSGLVLFVCRLYIIGRLC